MSTITAYPGLLSEDEIRVLHPAVEIRGGKDADIPFMMRRALMDLRYADFVRMIPDVKFYHYTHKLLEHHSWDGKVLVAHAAGSPDDILGYIIYRKTKAGLMVVYLYVRKDKDGPNYRGQGIARKLLEAAGWKDGERLTYLIRTAIFRFSKSFRDYVDNIPNVEHNLFPLFSLLDKDWESRKPGQ